MRGSRARDYAFVQNENRTFSKSANYRADQFSLEQEIPTVTNRACLGHIWTFLLLGEIEKCRSVTRKTRETDSSSEESEGGQENGVEEPVEVEEEEHSYCEEGKSNSDEDSERDHQEDGKDLDGKSKKKYRKGMTVFDFLLKANARIPPFTTSLTYSGLSG